MTNQLNWNVQSLPIDLSESDSSQLFSRFMVIWLAGTAFFLPVKILNLPFNFELVDFWILMGMPVGLLLYSFRRSRSINLSYMIPMWFILIGSLISTIPALSASRSLIILLKEVYVFLWFIMVSTFLSLTTAEDFRRILRIWSVAVVLHGFVIIVQFFSPNLWHFTNSLGGDVVTHEIYRPAGLFICDAAGCANKAAFFQVLGFAPLMLAGFSRRSTTILGLVLFASLMCTGSMGATFAFFCGLVATVVIIAYLKKNLLIIAKLFLQFIMALLLLGGLFYIVASQNPAYLNQLEKIAFGRFDKSSGSRFSLWGRGIDMFLDNNVFFVGVGPGNFKVLDTGGSNQLHNDTLAFMVERGVFGLTGLVLFVLIAVVRAFYIVQTYIKYPDRGRLEVVIFLGILVATLVESLTHQVFHARELWLVLALQEAVFLKMITSENGIELPPSNVVDRSLRKQNPFVVISD